MNAFLYYKISITGDKQEYLPVTRHGEGLSWLSGGSRLYESCLRWYLSSTSDDVTASTLHRVGRDTIDKLLSRIDQVSVIMLVMCENGFSVPIPSHSYTVYSFFPTIASQTRFPFSLSSTNLFSFHFIPTLMGLM